MGFRRQEEHVVVRILRGRYAGQGLAEPADDELRAKASRSSTRRTASCGAGAATSSTS